MASTNVSAGIGAQRVCPEKDGLFAVYVHWPFCASKCPYCDFNSHVRESIDHGRWSDAYLREIGHYASQTPGRTVTSVFFGGGTPSLMEPETVAAILKKIGESWVLSPDIEITLEANPSSVEAGKFRAFRQAGVNRVSLGIQALNEDDLKFLGRRHDVKEALQAIETARENFERYSFDLIYARPGQSPPDWRAELARALDLAGGHLSLYQLTIEQGTPFYVRHQRGEFCVPDGEAGGALYETTQEVMAAAGLPAYEVSNHARPGHESRHNLAYWRYADYAGIGPGAHGRLTLEGQKWATRAHRAPELWLERVARNGHGAHEPELVAPQDRVWELLMMGLRLREGVRLRRVAEESGRPWREVLDPRKIEALVHEGLLVCTDEVLQPTAAGLQRLNGVLEFLTRS